MSDQSPGNFADITKNDPFRFACHPGLDCFTECCRQLDLALTPYDVLRLKNGLGMHSGAFLEQYVIIEWDERIRFPQCYLTMVDDGRASCVFVAHEGCTVYADRPGACRAYPVGRGAARKNTGRIEEMLVLVREPHCLGFEERTEQTPVRYFTEQGLTEYSLFNDMITTITQHPAILNGYRPSRTQLDQYLMALYNLDTFRQEFGDGRISLKRPLQPDELQGLTGDDEKLLLLGVRWLQQEFFGE